MFLPLEINHKSHILENIDSDGDGLTDLEDDDDDNDGLLDSGKKIKQYARREYVFKRIN